MSTKNRFLWLDFLRGAAAIGVLSFHVVVNHKPQLDGLYVLVDFFFVLSGYVLWPSMPQGRSGGLRKSLRFLAARLLRLWPMLIAVLLVSNLGLLISHFVTHDPHWDSHRNWNFIVAALLFLQTIVSTSMFMVVPLWSLSAEFITNLLYIPITLAKSNKAIVYAIFGGYLSLNIGLTMDRGWIDFIGPIRAYEAIGRAIIGFGIGLLLRKNIEQLSKFRHPILLAVAAYASWWSLFSNQGFGYNNTYFVGLIYAFLILQLSPYELNAESRIGKFAAFLGKYSYGIYAYHQVMIDFTKNVVKEPGYWKIGSVWTYYFIEKCSLVCFLAILATYLTNKLFEGPIQRWGAKKLNAATRP